MIDHQSQHAVIVGGGFVGCLAAMMLASENLRITVIEAKPIASSPPSDPRGIALNHASCEHLKQLGLWAEVSKQSMLINTVHVSAKGSFSKVRFHAEEQGVDYLAAVIEGTHLLNVLSEHTKKLDHIEWLQPETVGSIEHNNDSINVNLASGRLLSSQLLLAADGQHSACRKMLDIQANSKTTEHALLTNVTLKASHNNIAYERFTKKGTIALLPLTHEQCKLVITGSENQIHYWQNLSDDVFIASLQKLFGAFAGTFTAISKRIHYPLTEMTVEQQTKGRAILLGNAAHSIHPIAAQGLNLAIQDLMKLSNLINNTQGDIDSTELLASYEKSIKPTQSKTMKLTKALSKMRGGFINRSALALVASCPMLKSTIANQALGR
jgi:2-octaprenyl-6-methoxyphenol hydroxylase